jgi:hypothetical protein
MEFIETEPYEKGFAEYYKKEILPLQKKMEEERLKYCDLHKKAKKRITIIVIIEAIILVCVMLAFPALLHHFLNDFDDLIDGAFVVCLFFAIPCAGLFYYPEVYTKKVKNNIMGYVASFFKGFNYSEIGCIDPVKISDSRLFSFKDEDVLSKLSSNGVMGEDLFVGNHNGVGIEVVEMRKDSIRDEGFTGGLFVLFDLGARNFQGKTIGLKNWGSCIKNDVNRPLGIIKKDMNKVNLEDSEFSNMFNVYSTSQIDSRVALDPAFMERIKSLFSFFQKKYKSKNMAFSFYENKCFIKVSISKNLFEPGGLFETCIQTGYIKDFLKEMHMIMEIAEILKMERKAR